MKTLYFIRHGKATHNHDFKKFGEKAYVDIINTDSGLTEVGMDQAISLNENIYKFIFDNKVNLIITSPLRRCIMTSLLVFKDIKVPIIANDFIREFPAGEHTPNKRMSKNDLNYFFGSKIYFDNVEDYDTLWTPEKENLESLDNRINKFFEFIKNRKEDNIMIVSHASFMSRLIYKDLNKSIKHCKIYKYELH